MVSALANTRQSTADSQQPTAGASGVDIVPLGVWDNNTLVGRRDSGASGVTFARPKIYEPSQVAT